jgi:predicted dienelactone hydrolase
MRRKLFFKIGGIILLVSLLIISCTRDASPPETPAASSSPNEAANAENPLPLASPGVYPVGIRRNIVFLDDSRGGREVRLTIWYPASADSGAPGEVIPDAPPDMSAVPYPVILSSSKLGFLFASSLVSHGFSYIGVNKIDSYLQYDNNVVDQPRDLVFALNMMAENPPAGLEGVLNTNIVGSLGYSFDAFNALTLGGARIDPSAYRQDCENAASRQPAPPDWWIEYICGLLKNWDEFAAYAVPGLSAGADVLWPSITDPRIKAVLPMGPEGAWLFNQRGLAAVDRPIFFISAEEDDINIYDLEAAVLFEQTGAQEKFMVTILDQNHMMIGESRPLEIMKHFANAFFGYYLQGHGEYLEMFSEQFVSGYEELAWGVYKD